MPENIDKYQFYKAVLIVIDAVKTFARRYSDLALELAESADGKRKEELEEIARICKKVPYEKAETFYEAIQSTWFIQLILQIESNGHSLSYGRFDQYIYPYYKHDKDLHNITEEQAIELLDNLWIKTLTINKVRSQAHTFSSAGSPMYQNVTIGGQTPDKKDATNELSYLVLKSVAQTRLPQPNLTVRYHKNMPKAFLDEAIEVMKLGTGMPAFNNDEIIIPSFIEKGVKEEDAYNYSAIGCVETAVPGKWGYRCTGMSYMNFPRILLMAMNDGVDMTSGKRFFEGSGYFKDMTSYDELFKAIEKGMRHLTRMSVIVENAIDLALERDVPDVLCSALTEDCIGRGKTIKEGGAVYDFISGLQVGIANMADSLAAIKKLVFEEKKITPEELWNAILDDYTSKESQRIQEMLINDAPKYGNDIDDTTSPLEAGLGWITKFVDGKNFTNRAALERQKAEGVTRKLIGFEMIDRGIPRHGYTLTDAEGNEIGHVTSGTMSPIRKIGIGMGYVKAEYAKPGTEIWLDNRGRKLKAQVVKPPFRH